MPPPVRALASLVNCDQVQPSCGMATCFCLNRSSLYSDHHRTEVVRKRQEVAVLRQLPDHGRLEGLQAVVVLLDEGIERDEQVAVRAGVAVLEPGQARHGVSRGLDRQFGPVVGPARGDERHVQIGVSLAHQTGVVLPDGCLARATGPEEPG